MGSLHSNDTCSGSLNSFVRETNKTASPNFVGTRYQQVVGLCWWVSRHWERQLELGAEVGLSLAVVAVVYWTTPASSNKPPNLFRDDDDWRCQKQWQKIKSCFGAEHSQSKLPPTNTPIPHERSYSPLSRSLRAQKKRLIFRMNTTEQCSVEPRHQADMFGTSSS